MGRCTLHRRHFLTRDSYNRRLTCGAAPPRSPVTTYPEASARWQRAAQQSQQLSLDNHHAAQHHARDTDGLPVISLDTPVVALLHSHVDAGPLPNSLADPSLHHPQHPFADHHSADGLAASAANANAATVASFVTAQPSAQDGVEHAVPWQHKRGRFVGDLLTPNDTAQEATTTQDQAPARLSSVEQSQLVDGHSAADADLLPYLDAASRSGGVASTSEERPPRTTSGRGSRFAARQAKPGRAAARSRWSEELEQGLGAGPTAVRPPGSAPGEPGMMGRAGGSGADVVSLPHSGSSSSTVISSIGSTSQDVLLRRSVNGDVVAGSNDCVTGSSAGSQLGSARGGPNRQPPSQQPGTSPSSGGSALHVAPEALTLSPSPHPMYSSSTIPAASAFTSSCPPQGSVDRANEASANEGSSGGAAAGRGSSRPASSLPPPRQRTQPQYHPTPEEHAMLRQRAELRRAAQLPRKPLPEDLWLTQRVMSACHWREVVDLVSAHLEEYEGRGAQWSAEQVAPQHPQHSPPHQQHPQNSQQPRHSQQRHTRQQQKQQTMKQGSHHVMAPIPAEGPVQGAAGGGGLRQPEPSQPPPQTPPHAPAVGTAAVQQPPLAARSSAPPAGSGPPVGAGGGVGAALPVSALPFTPQHVAAILSRTAELLELLGGPKSAAEARRLHGMVDGLARVALVMLPSPGMGVRELVMIFYALVRMRRPCGKPYFIALMTAARQRFNTKPAAELDKPYRSGGKWRIGRVKQAAAPPPLPYNGQDMALLLWCVARCGMAGLRHEWRADYFKALTRVSGELTPQGVSLVLYGMALLKATPPPELLKVLCTRLSGQLESDCEAAAAAGGASGGDGGGAAGGCGSAAVAAVPAGEEVVAQVPELVGGTAQLPAPSGAGRGGDVAVEAIAASPSGSEWRGAEPASAATAAVAVTELPAGVSSVSSGSDSELEVLSSSSWDPDADGSWGRGRLQSVGKQAKGQKRKRRGGGGATQQAAPATQQQQQQQQQSEEGGETSDGDGMPVTAVGSGAADLGLAGAVKAPSCSETVTQITTERLEELNGRGDKGSEGPQAYSSSRDPKFIGDAASTTARATIDAGDGEFDQATVDRATVHATSTTPGSDQPLSESSNPSGPLQLVPHLRCRPVDVSMALWALATLRLPPTPTSPDFLPNIERFTFIHLHDFPEQELSNLMWALARLQRTPPPHWMARLYDVVYDQMPYLRPQALATLLYSLAQMGQRPGARWLDAAAQQALVELRGFTPQGLALLLHSLATMGYRPKHGWMDAFHARLESHRGQMDIRVRDKVREAYQVFGFRPGPPLSRQQLPAYQQQPQQHQQQQQHLGQLVQLGTPRAADAAAVRRAADGVPGAAGVGTGGGGVREGDLVAGASSRWYAQQRGGSGARQQQQQHRQHLERQQQQQRLQEGQQRRRPSQQQEEEAEGGLSGLEGLGAEGGWDQGLGLGLEVRNDPAGSWEFGAREAEEVAAQVLVRPSRFG